MQSKMSAAALAATLISCGGGGDGSCPVGFAGCPCTRGGACDPGLECVDGTCLGPTVDAGADTVPEIECASDGECDDGDPCTADTCDADWGECAHGPQDADGDGYVAASVGETVCPGGTDCDDEDATNHPGADTDGDGYEDARCGGDDCDDAEALVHPGAPIVECSFEDNDCDGNVDRDDDGDGHVDFDCGGDDCLDDDALTILGECPVVDECCDGCTNAYGCWVDPTTGLMWADPPAEWLSWEEAISFCAALSLTGHGPGEWHLPTISELRTLARGCPFTEEGGGCAVTDECLTACWTPTCRFGCGMLGGPGPEGCYWDPALSGECGIAWSSSAEVETDPEFAWGYDFFGGGIDWFYASQAFGVRCVRPAS